VRFSQVAVGAVRPGDRKRQTALRRPGRGGRRRRALPQTGERTTPQGSESQGPVLAQPECSAHERSGPVILCPSLDSGPPICAYSLYRSGTVWKEGVDERCVEMGTLTDP